MPSFADTILFGTSEAVAQHLAQGARVNEIDEYGFTPLIESIIADRYDIGQLLLSHGADVHESDLTGSTALHWAVENNNVGFVKTLLAHQADANAYNAAHQPVLVKALLRDQHMIKKLLYQQGGDLNFAQDYINTKLLGHRFELTDQADIVTPKGKFIALEFAGFFLEFTLGIIYYSLRQFLNNFAARDFRFYFQHVKPVLDALVNANQLIFYQQYLHNFEQYNSQIKSFLHNNPLIIPIACEGHAICFVKHGSWLAKCDRGANSKEEGSVNLYEIHNLEACTPDLLKNLIYKRQSMDIIHHKLYDFLALEKIGEIPIRSQIVGNCSWANVEATIPTLFFMNMLKDEHFHKADQALPVALNFYDQWQTWDKDVALNECIQSFWLANPARKASKAAVLGAILFQTCHNENPIDQSRAKRILQVLTTTDYQYVLKSYLKVYYQKHHAAAGQRLMALLRNTDLHLPDYLTG